MSQGALTEHMEKTAQKIVRVQRMHTLIAIRSRETAPVYMEERAQIVPTVSIAYIRVYIFFLLMTKHILLINIISFSYDMEAVTKLKA